jgi:hypothetical protein
MAIFLNNKHCRYLSWNNRIDLPGLWEAEEEEETRVEKKSDFEEYSKKLHCAVFARV